MINPDHTRLPLGIFVMRNFLGGRHGIDFPHLPQGLYVPNPESLVSLFLVLQIELPWNVIEFNLIVKPHFWGVFLFPYDWSHPTQISIGFSSTLPHCVGRQLAKTVFLDFRPHIRVGILFSLWGMTTAVCLSSLNCLVWCNRRRHLLLPEYTSLIALGDTERCWRRTRNAYPYQTSVRTWLWNCHNFLNLVCIHFLHGLWQSQLLKD